jgi:hypothetical protein
MRRNLFKITLVWWDKPDVKNLLDLVGCLCHNAFKPVIFGDVRKSK